MVSKVEKKCLYVGSTCIQSDSLDYLVQEALAELVHGTLKLATLALPLLVVAHRLSCRPLPCCGSGVVVHIVEPAPLVHSFLPARRVGKTGRGVCDFKQHLY